MKSKLIILSTMIFALFSLAGIGQAQDFIKGFSFKFTGGYGTMTTGDYNTFGDGLEKYISCLATLLEGTTSGEFKKLNMGFGYEGEFILKLYRGFHIGVGIGYIQRNNESEFGLTTPYFWNYSFAIKPNLTANPINVSVYYFTSGIFPLKLFFYGGVGCYFGKITNTTRIVTHNFWSKADFDVKDRAFGFHGGVGLEFKLISKCVLFIEGRTRYCKLKSWEGEETYQDSDGFKDLRRGTLWYFEKQDPITGMWYLTISMDIGGIPESSDIRNVKKFEADLSGFSLRAGIRIRF